MTQINLLPWREQKREQEKTLFIMHLGICIVIAVFILSAINYYALNLASNQHARNQMVQQEIAIYERQIKEIKNLEKIREGLLSRMAIVRDLQSTRTMMVHLFDELIKVTPSGVFLTRIEGKNNLITLFGYAESNTSISLAMKNIEHDEWIHSPVLNEIKKMDDKNQTADNQFKLTFILEAKNLIGAVHE